MIDGAVELARGQHDAAAPVEFDQPARTESAVAHRLDRGNERLPDARQEGSLPTQTDGLHHGARGEIEAEKRPIADRTSRVAVQRHPQRVFADGHPARMAR